MAIWVIKDGKREGPYEEQDVRELVFEGTYLDSDPAIRDGQYDWTTVGQVLGRQHPLPAQPPPPMPPPTSTPMVPPPPGARPTPPPAAAIPDIEPPQRRPEPPPMPAAAQPEPPEPPLPVGATVPGMPDMAGPPPPQRPIQVAVTDFEMPFGSMVILMVKWVLASIPALFILGAIAAIFWMMFFALVALVAHH